MGRLVNGMHDFMLCFIVGFVILMTGCTSPSKKANSDSAGYVHYKSNSWTVDQINDSMAICIPMNKDIQEKPYVIDLRSASNIQIDTIKRDTIK